MAIHRCKWNCGGTDCPAPTRSWTPEFAAMVRKAHALVTIKRQPFFMPIKVPNAIELTGAASPRPNDRRE